MPDSKISALSSGAPALGTDETVIARGGSNYKLTVAQILAYLGVPISVASGGTGATTLTGLVKGNGTGAFTAAAAGTDYVAPNAANTFTATQTFSVPVELADGTASAPTLANVGDTDTGIYHPAANELAVTTGGTVAAAFNSGGIFFRNRIINGDMRIDQRNAGAAVTINSAANTYTLDRWNGFGQAADGVFTVTQSSVAPAGFVNSALVTVTTADASIGATQTYSLNQPIEGTNVADLGYGTATAATVTLSFWVRSSLTGVFGGAVTNSAGNRAYPFTFAIAAANTWEYKSVTIPGDTTGTWLTTTGIGLYLRFSLGAGSSVSATAGAWTSTASVVSATGATNLIATNGATFYITGVQLETGSVATPFERRPFGTDLMLCQRYFQVLRGGWGAGQSTTGVGFSPQFICEMRGSPTANQTGVMTVSDGATDYVQSATNLVTYVTFTNMAVLGLGNYTGLTANRPYFLRGNNSNAITLAAEL